MADSTTEIDLDSVIDRLLEGELRFVFPVLLLFVAVMSNVDGGGAGSLGRPGWACRTVFGAQREGRPVVLEELEIPPATADATLAASRGRS